MKILDAPTAFCPDDEIISEIKAQSCGKKHEACRGGGNKSLSPEELTVTVLAEIEDCTFHLGGLNVCCAHKTEGIDILREHLNTMEESEETEQMTSFIDFHQEAMEALDGIRIEFETQDRIISEVNNFNTFIQGNEVDLTGKEMNMLCFSDEFVKNVERDALVGAIKVREMILGRKIEEIRDYILDCAEENEEESAY